jgi:hypothetical protein
VTFNNQASEHRMHDDLSTFASVFKKYASTDALALWSKVHDSNELSQLRSKYWGNQIEVGTQQWRDSHPIADEITMNDIGPACHRQPPPFEVLGQGRLRSHIRLL